MKNLPDKLRNIFYKLLCCMLWN